MYYQKVLMLFKNIQLFTALLLKLNNICNVHPDEIDDVCMYIPYNFSMSHPYEYTNTKNRMY